MAYTAVHTKLPPKCQFNTLCPPKYSDVFYGWPLLPYLAVFIFLPCYKENRSNEVNSPKIALGKSKLLYLANMKLG